MNGASLSESVNNRGCVKMAAARGGQVKRRNPFEDEVPLQLKVRVGPKQISDDKEMDMVYGKGKIDDIITNDNFIHNSIH